jgi:hypothetical protein
MLLVYGRGFWARMTWLIDAQLPTSGERQLNQKPPPLMHYRTAFDSPSLHHLDEVRDVAAHEVELVLRITVARMDRHLRGGERENEPTPAGIDIR